MKKIAVFLVIVAGLILTTASASAQKKGNEQEVPKTESQLILEQAENSENPVTISLEQALEIALSENVSVKVADMEIERTGFAKKGTYAALFPQIDASGSYQRTIKKQVMYMDFDMSALGGGGSSSSGTTEPETATKASSSSSSNGGGIEMGRWNSFSAGLTAAMPLVNATLWESIKISGLDVELAVEKARSSRLETVTQVKNAYFATLLAKEAFAVYKDVYENAVKNLEEAEKKYKAEKTSEVEYLRAKTTVANAIPNVFNAESSVVLALWQLKAVLGVDLDMNIDITGALGDYAEQMFYDIHSQDSTSLDNNSTMRQLAIQTEQLARAIKIQQNANIPTLSLAFNFSYSAMTNDFNFSEFRWTPYSVVGLSLNIPIFAGGKRHQQIRQAKNQYEQVQLQVENTERQLQISIRQSLNTMETQMKSYYAAQSAVELAGKAYDIAEAAYRLGSNTLIELNDAQLSLTQAKLAESQAIYNFVIAKAQLEQTLGQDFIKE